MKKIILLLIICFLVTGCSVNYEVEIYNDKVNESVDFIFKGSNSKDETKQLFNDALLKYELLEMDRNYEPFYIKKEKKYSMHSLIEYDFDDYKKQTSYFSNCCRAISFADNGKYITFKFLGYIKYFEQYDNLDEIKFTVKSNHKLVETNADEIDRYSYTWNLNRDNYKDVLPYIKLYSNKYVFDYSGNLMKRVIVIVSIVAIIVLVGSLSYGFIYVKGKNSNRI